MTPRLTGCLAWLCALLLAFGGASTHAGEQAERAVAAVKQLIEQGQIRPGTTLRLRAKQGNTVSFLGRDYELQRAWEAATGIPIDASTMPQLDSLAFIRQAGDIDLTIARNHEYADLVHEGLIEDLTPWLARFGFQLADGPDSGYLLPRHQAWVGERIVAIPADADVALLYLRGDLLEDPARQAAFRARYGAELRVPRTWQDLQRQIEFFHRPDEGFYGYAVPREPLTGWMYWMPRYLSGAAPYQPLFDDQMKPLIDRPAGVQATREYVATVAFSPPEVLKPGNDYSYTLQFFLRGNAYATILTPAGAKIAHRESSAVRGRFVTAALPGRVVDGRLVQRSHFIYGNNLVVPSASSNKALAVLFAMWLTDPDNATRSVAANGFADPYRHNSLRDERVLQAYTPQAMQMLAAQLAHTAPAGTGLPGNHAYIEALNDSLWLAAKGELTPQAAMQRTAKAWEAITERLGRDRQAAHWRSFRALYPSVTEAAR